MRISAAVPLDSGRSAGTARDHERCWKKRDVSRGSGDDEYRCVLCMTFRNTWTDDTLKRLDGVINVANIL